MQQPRSSAENSKKRWDVFSSSFSSLKALKFETFIIIFSALCRAVVCDVSFSVDIKTSISTRRRWNTTAKNKSRLRRIYNLMSFSPTQISDPQKRLMPVTPIQGPIYLKNGSVPVVPLYSYPRVLNDSSSNNQFMQIPVSTHTKHYLIKAMTEEFSMRIQFLIE